MNRKQKIITGVAAGVLVLGGATAAVAGSVMDDDTPITGEALDRASQAALDHVGEGEVTDTEVDDEESKYEVEVTRDDGSEIDVQLDEDFTVVSDEAETEDEDEADDEDEGADSDD